jgi:hypothetical protein
MSISLRKVTQNLSKRQLLGLNLLLQRKKVAVPELELLSCC